MLASTQSRTCCDAPPSDQHITCGCGVHSRLGGWERLEPRERAGTVLAPADVVIETLDRSLDGQSTNAQSSSYAASTVPGPSYVPIQL
jgi:hypothetical protein